MDSHLPPPAPAPVQLGAGYLPRPPCSLLEAVPTDSSMSIPTLHPRSSFLPHLLARSLQPTADNSYAIADNLSRYIAALIAARLGSDDVFDSLGWLGAQPQWHLPFHFPETIRSGEVQVNHRAPIPSRPAQHREQTSSAMNMPFRQSQAKLHQSTRSRIL